MRNANNHHRRSRSGRSGGFTLVEMLVVLLIVLLLSVAALSALPGAQREQKVNEAARVVQAVFSQARDTAIRANAPRGVRLIPDSQFPGPSFANPLMPLGYSHMLMIEPAPDYSDGVARPRPNSIVWPDPTTNPLLFPIDPNQNPYGPVGFYQGLPAPEPRLHVYEQTYITVAGTDLPEPPTSWYWNVRQGDQIEFGNSGKLYTIAGPNLVGNATNPERYVNWGQQLVYPPWTFQTPPYASPNLPAPFGNGAEILYLVNGIDDNGNGFVDESFDGIDNDGDGVTDPGFDGVDNNGDGNIDDPNELLWSAFNGGSYTGGEYEQETFVGSAYISGNQPYKIKRRPVLSQSGNQEVSLPTGTIIDATTFNSRFSSPERSRLPIDPYTGYVDIMLNPTGEVVQMNASGSSAPYTNLPFYHFWIAEREDIHTPLWGFSTVNNAQVLNPNPSASNNAGYNLLPMPAGYGYVGSTYLKGGRRLVTLFPKSGQLVANEISAFSPIDLNVPYYNAQVGQRDLK